MKHSKGVLIFYAENGYPLAERQYGQTNKFRFVIWERLHNLRKKGKKISHYHVCPDTNDELIDKKGKNIPINKKQILCTQ